MNKSLKSFAIRAVAISTLTLAAMGSANAAVFFYRTGVVVAPVVVAPVVVALAPIVVAPVYIPTCRLISVPFVNAFTGLTYLATRRVCN